MAQHDPCNVDRVMPGPHLKLDRSTRHDPFLYQAVPGPRMGGHDPFLYQAVPGPRMGGHEPGRAWAGPARHGIAEDT
jgi:hypothetical protein